MISNRLIIDNEKQRLTLKFSSIKLKRSSPNILFTQDFCYFLLPNSSRESKNTDPNISTLYQTSWKFNQISLFDAIDFLKLVPNDELFQIALLNNLFHFPEYYNNSPTNINEDEELKRLNSVINSLSIYQKVNQISVSTAESPKLKL